MAKQKAIPVVTGKNGEELVLDNITTKDFESQFDTPKGFMNNVMDVIGKLVPDCVKDVFSIDVPMFVPDKNIVKFSFKFKGCDDDVLVVLNIGYDKNPTHTLGVSHDNGDNWHVLTYTYSSKKP